MKHDKNSYSIWIEVEHVVQTGYDPIDDNTDVIVTREDRSRWGASFFTYKNIETLRKRYKETGENLSGAYVWGDHMLLIDIVTRQRIEEVVQDLMKRGYFESVFEAFPDIEDDE